MSAMSPTIFILYIILLCFHLPLCFTRDTITLGDSIRDQHRETLISPGERFELGFFRTMTSPKRYLGIWYYKSNPKIIVWVANRDNPLSDDSGVFAIAEDGNLNVWDGNKKSHWSTKFEGWDSFKRMVKLNDSGNLVLIKEDEQSGSLTDIWQSFNEPTDTFLPGMKMDQNMKLISWSSLDNPASGSFTFQKDEVENQYIIRKDKSTVHWKTGVSGKFINSDISPVLSYMLTNFTGSSLNINIFRKRNIISPKIVLSSILDGNNIRLVMDVDGKVKLFIRNNESVPWGLTLSEPKDQCSVYKACGNFASCKKQLCNCLPGFEPVSPDNWDAGDFLQGCQRTTPCSTDDNKSRKFSSLNVTNVGKPEAEFEVESEIECIDECLKDCNCPAYAYSETPQSRGRVGNSTCWIWSDNLNNIEEATGTHVGREIHIRMQHMRTNITKPGQDVSVANGRKTNWPLIVAAVTIVSAIILACFILYISIQKKNAERQDRTISQPNIALRFYDSERHVKDMVDSDQFKEEDKKCIDLPFFDFESILVATDTFSEANKLGKGGFGPVYKGKFPGGQEIAVKRLSSISIQGLEEFKNEIVLIARLQHRNLVRLLGYCIEGREKILLYEYMPNKSLDIFIFDHTVSVLLDWEIRFNIILGIARGLLYLHQDSRLRIIHRDLKTSNILLDQEMNPKISDFGLAKIFESKQTEGTTNRIVGTYGYLSPEYALDGFFSVKSDVFSFGVVVLEIMSGKRSTGFYNIEQPLSLLGYAWKLWQEDKALDMIDQKPRASSKTNEILKCINVGLLCVQEDPNDRPTMSKVVVMLGSEATNLPSPKRPAFVVRRGLSSTASSSSKPESNNELTLTLEAR